MDLLVSVASGYVNAFDLTNFMAVIWNELYIFQAFSFPSGLMY